MAHGGAQQAQRAQSPFAKAHPEAPTAAEAGQHSCMWHPGKVWAHALTGK